MARVTGIGGVFFKARNDKEALSAWYREHLGVELDLPEKPNVRRRLRHSAR